MMRDYLRSFTRVTVQPAVTEAGGVAETLHVQETFAGGLLPEREQTVSSGGREAVRCRCRLMAEGDVPLSAGDLVRDERDGSLWRVTGGSSLRQTPAGAELRAVILPVERVVRPG